MDPRPPFNQSGGYTGLMHSQHDSVGFGNSPYEIPPFSSQGSSQIPQFPSPVSSQTSHFRSQQFEAPSPAAEAPVERGKRHKWTPAEDGMLISAWLNTSKDSIVGNNQKSGTFWKRVGEDLFASLSGGEPVESPDHLHFKQRWHKISGDTSKFCGAYAAAERRISSGQSDNDLLKMAHEIFFADHAFNFTLEHAWCVLRCEQKWVNLNTTKGSKRKGGETCSQDSVTGVVEEEVRPEGVKAAKANRSGAWKGKSVADIKTVAALRKEEFESKEKLSKLAILDTLLAKTQALSEAEDFVKNKLLLELFQ